MTAARGGIESLYGAAPLAMMHGGQTMPMGEWMSWMMWVFMMVAWIVVVAAVVGGILLVVRAVRGDGGDSDAGRSRSPALDILEERYARGEIDSDEFNERRRALLD